MDPGMEGSLGRLSLGRYQTSDCRLKVETGYLVKLQVLQRMYHVYL